MLLKKKTKTKKKTKQKEQNKKQKKQKKKLWELIKWSPKRKCFVLLSNSLNSFFKEIYRDEFGEFVCGYWDLKG